MEHIFKYRGSKEQMKNLYENRESLDKYLARLKELMEKDDENEDDENETDSRKNRKPNT